MRRARSCLALYGSNGLSSQFSRLETILTRAWSRRGWLACLLFPVSLLFRALTALRRSFYAAGLLKSTSLPVPVIVVGNLFIGGTGKTPLVIWLVEALRRAGYLPGVISRGYGASHEAPLEVTADSAARQAGDEPVLIARRTQCPVVVGRQRTAAAQALLAAHPQVNVIVADDGLQHYALARDVEVALFDARGAGNGWVLPAGPLREPLSRRCDFTVINANRRPSGMPNDAINMQLAGRIAQRLCDRTQSRDVAAFASSAVIVAAAGIGNPARFFTMLRDAGLQFAEMPLPDHYDYRVNPFANLDADIILITEKDAVKCGQIDILKNDPRLWVVPVSAQIDGALAERILEKLRGHPIA